MSKAPDIQTDIERQKEFGKLNNEYSQDGLYVKIYSHDMTELLRTKTDILIREKINGIVSCLD